MENVESKGLKFEYLIPKLSDRFLVYLLSDINNIKKAFNLTDKACESFQRKILSYLRAKRVNSNRSMFKKIFNLI